MNINCSRFLLWYETLGPHVFSPNTVYATHMLVDSMNIQVPLYIKEE